ncbi:aldo/keto reductase family protein [Paenibacillus senegalensis]|uniref:aldo/keto reductase family protein n=1 Tax=Paenibacillus senegalensis TaxID=1465766 RepID=UPI00028984B2|nr:aldo/keto reductase family protein [Paenibacillus senegalensis]
MKYRKLGRSGVKVSEISLGSWLTYGEGGYVDKDKAFQIIDRAYESGINFFDTANIYMRGESEKAVGEALSKYPRHSYVLATKVWGKMGDKPNESGLSRKHIMEQCDASLKRLNMDYIDLYYCHHFDPDTPIDETMRAMNDLITQGKVLYIGVSNWTAAQINEAVRVADRYLLNRIVASQPPYNMLRRQIEQEIMPVSAQHGIGQVVYSPLAQGVLTGKYTDLQNMPEGSRAQHAKGSVSSYLNETTLAQTAQLKEIANDLGCTLSQLALAWILRKEEVSSAIIGASRPEQIDDNIKASAITLTEDTLDAIETILQPPTA